MENVTDASSGHGYDNVMGMTMTVAGDLLILWFHGTLSLCHFIVYYY